MIRECRLHLSRRRRILLSFYLVGLTYCLVWVPWVIESYERFGTQRQRVGYGWLWSGPQYPSQLRHSERRSGANFNDVEDFLAEEQFRQEWDSFTPNAFPDSVLIFLRIMALTTFLGTVAMVLRVTSWDGAPEQSNRRSNGKAVSGL